MATDRVFPCTEPITCALLRGVECACSLAPAELLPTAAPTAITSPAQDGSQRFIWTPAAWPPPSATPRHAKGCRTTARHWCCISCERRPGATPSRARVHRVRDL